LGPLRYFLIIKVPYLALQFRKQKYTVDILIKTGMIDCHPNNGTIDPNLKLLLGQGNPLKDPARYFCLVGKINYLTKLDTTYGVSMVSRFLKVHVIVMECCDTHTLIHQE